MGINLDVIDGGDPPFEETVIAAVDALRSYIGWLKDFHTETYVNDPAFKEYIDRAQRTLDDVLGWGIDPTLGGLIKP